MSRKGKRKLLFGLKVLAICAAAVFTVKGVDKFYMQGGNGINENENISEVPVAVLSNPDAVVAENIKENVKDEDGREEQPEIPNSTDWDSEDAYMLAKIAMAEAEGESIEGKALVILVVLNRVSSDEFPDSIAGVIFQKGQFSPVESGRYDRVEPNEECYEALELIQTEQWNESQGALYFESMGASHWHRDNLEFLFQYGRHYFYTDKKVAG